MNDDDVHAVEPSSAALSLLSNTTAANTTAPLSELEAGQDAVAAEAQAIAMVCTALLIASALAILDLYNDRQRAERKKQKPLIMPMV